MKLDWRISLMYRKMIHYAYADGKEPPMAPPVVV
jgi:hypothetical protein